METNLEYFSRRAAEERKAAEGASQREAQTAHAQLAGLYLDLARRPEPIRILPQG